MNVSEDLPCEIHRHPEPILTSELTLRLQQSIYKMKEVAQRCRLEIRIEAWRRRDHRRESGREALGPVRI